MKKIILLFLIIPIQILAQNSTDAKEVGIQWEQGLSWQQVKYKAKKQNKFIFIDCYATWCQPCKDMDRKVYPQAGVGNFFNNEFICIKVQVDKSSRDDLNIRKWYKDAELILKEYSVTAFPTFLFLNPSGEIVHRAAGGFDAARFIELGKNALDPEKQYYTLINKFQLGKARDLDLKHLSEIARFAGDDSLSKVIAERYLFTLDVNQLTRKTNGTYGVIGFLMGFKGDKKWIRDICCPKFQKLRIDELANNDYMHFLHFIGAKELERTGTEAWFNSLKPGEIFTKENLFTIKSHTHSPQDVGFDFLLKNADTINAIIKEEYDWVQSSIASIINDYEYFHPFAKPAFEKIKASNNGAVIQEPDWDCLLNQISQKYGVEYAQRLAYLPKIHWYRLIGDMSQYAANLSYEMERTRGWNLNGFVLNNMSMYIFMYGTKRSELETAASFMKEYLEKNSEDLKTDGGTIDTYASLLYKMGKIKEAIEWQQRAIATGNVSENVKRNFDNMKKGLPTWETKYSLKN